MKVVFLLLHCKTVIEFIMIDEYDSWGDENAPSQSIIIYIQSRSSLQRDSTRTFMKKIGFNIILLETSPLTSVTR